MYLQFFLALLLAALSNLSLPEAEKVILCVPSSRERFCDGFTECSRNNTVLLQDLSFRREDFVDIYLCSTEYNTTDVSNITLANLQSINITGNGSMINCQSNQFGFHFQNVSRVAIKNITLHQCGLDTEVDTEEDATGLGNFTAGIYITDSSNISLSNVCIQSTPGIGLVLLRNHGYINIANSHFIENHDSNFTQPGGGALITTSSSQSSNYHINSCVFSSNGALRESTLNSDENFDSKKIDFSRGGGVNAYFQDHTAGISMNIVDCTFENNSAAYGGAVYFFIKDSAQNVNVALSESQFHNNTAFERGGGLAAGYIHGSQTIQVFLCNFTSNTAEYGGGTYVYANPMEGHETIHSSGITFNLTSWTENTAMYGSAVYASPYTARRFYEYGHFPALLFQNCWFSSNRRCNRRYGLFVFHSRGTIYSHTVNIWLKEVVSFTENENSALHLFSSILEIRSNSTIRFKSNTAYQGGAIHMEGFSSIYLNDNSSIFFDSNFAFDKGAAIYHETPVDLTLFSVKNCFVNYVGDYRTLVEDRMIDLYFHNSSSTRSKQFIYLFSAKPCYRTIHQYSITDALNSTANFYFSTNETAISTAPSNFTVMEDLPQRLTLIPGIEKKINVAVVDDTNSSIMPPVYEVKVKRIGKSTINVLPLYATVNDNKINLYGNMGSKGTVTLNLNRQPNMYLAFNVTLQDCPPGYVEKTEGKQRTCYCSAYTEHQYVGIKKCNDTSNQANLSYGYWAGYVNSTATSNFRVANCPRGYCSHETAEVSLPYSPDELNDVVCSKNRHGIVCALCKNGTSVIYHTQLTLLCRDETSCNLGILL